MPTLSPQTRQSPAPPANQKYGPLSDPTHPAVCVVHLRNAIELLSEHDLSLPEPDQLHLIVQSALAAETLYFSACLHHPGTAELRRMFEMFLIACMTSSQETETT